MLLNGKEMKEKDVIKQNAIILVKREKFNFEINK